MLEDLLAWVSVGGFDVGMVYSDGFDGGFFDGLSFFIGGN